MICYGEVTGAHWDKQTVYADLQRTETSVCTRFPGVKIQKIFNTRFDWMREFVYFNDKKVANLEEAIHLLNQELAACPDNSPPVSVAIADKKRFYDFDPDILDEGDGVYFGDGQPEAAAP